MPYVSCPRCHLRSYVGCGYAYPVECPNCAARVPSSTLPDVQRNRRSPDAGERRRAHRRRADDRPEARGVEA
jgi:hypothetical protein